jgi:hypothetical protein
MSLGEMIAKHSMKNLLTEFTIGAPTQYLEHRGSIFYPDRMDNTHGAYRRSLERGISAIEIDVALTLPDVEGQEPGMICSHDRGPFRYLLDFLDQPWRSLRLAEVKHRPIVAKQLRNGAFTGKFFVTDQRVRGCLTEPAQR